MDWISRVVFFVMYISVAISVNNEEDKSEPSSTAVPNDQDNLSLAINEFGFKLLTEEMKSHADSNVVMSPTGIAGLLAMTLLGSAGKTYSELAATLGFSQGNNIIQIREETTSFVRLGSPAKGHWLEDIDILRNRAHHEEFGLLLNVLTNSSSKTSYADAIFVEPRTRVRPIYRDYLRRVYRGEARVAPFFDVPRARDIINEWISNNTNGIINEFLRQPLPAETKVALLTALYFSGQWARPFTPEYTKKMPFKTSAGDIMADLMLNYGEFKYLLSIEDGLHMIALPYNDSTTTMYVLKPHKDQPLAELMYRLNYSRIDHLITRMITNKAVIVRFPKMEIESSMHLEDSLKALGLGAMFSPTDSNFALMIDANKEVNSTEEELLTRINFEDSPVKDIKDAINRLPNPGVYVDTVLHDVKININEYGTEAVAATGGFLTRSAQQFYANSPFYMFIRNEETKLVTFSAAIYNPTV